MVCFALIAVGSFLPISARAQAPAENRVKVASFHGYPRCLIIENASTRVVVCPESGGRVLEYSWNGKNALYLEEQETGKPYQPGSRASMSAGRFDIGPEKVIPRHPKLWSGVWRGRIMGSHHVQVISAKDEATGVQLIRDFKLDPHSSHLACTQTIRNVSDSEKQWCHWSRTFALGNGVCLIPLSSPSRFPNSYVMYEGGDQINIRPQDPNIRQRDGFLEILGVPREPKLGMDSQIGWFAYLMKNDLMFVKRFQVYPDRVYNEAAGLTISIWYPQDRRVELEPIGPREKLAPGASASFTENWYLLEQAFPSGDAKIDLQGIKRRVERETKPATE